MLSRLLLTSFLVFGLQAMEFEKLFENEKVCVSHFKLMSGEQVGEHYDIYPQIVTAIEGGIITRIEADGSTTDVNFPTGVAVFRLAETSDKMHKSINNGSNPIELIIIQFK